MNDDVLKHTTHFSQKSWWDSTLYGIKCFSFPFSVKDEIAYWYKQNNYSELKS